MQVLTVVLGSILMTYHLDLPYLLTYLLMLYMYMYMYIYLLTRMAKSSPIVVVYFILLNHHASPNQICKFKIANFKRAIEAFKP